MEKIKHIVLIAPPNTSILDIAGPLEVFSKANDYIHDYIPNIEKPYALHVVTTQTSKIVNTSSGLPIISEGTLKSINYEVDTVLVAGNHNAPKNRIYQETLNWLSEQSTTIRRVGSICAGAFILCRSRNIEWQESNYPLEGM